MQEKIGCRPDACISAKRRDCLGVFGGRLTRKACMNNSTERQVACASHANRSHRGHGTTLRRTGIVQASGCLTVCCSSGLRKPSMCPLCCVGRRLLHGRNIRLSCRVVSGTVQAWMTMQSCVRFLRRIHACYCLKTLCKKALYLFCMDSAKAATWVRPLFNESIRSGVKPQALHFSSCTMPAASIHVRRILDVRHTPSLKRAIAFFHWRYSLKLPRNTEFSIENYRQTAQAA